MTSHWTVKGHLCTFAGKAKAIAGTLHKTARGLAHRLVQGDRPARIAVATDLVQILANAASHGTRQGNVHPVTQIGVGIILTDEPTLLCRAVRHLNDQTFRILTRTLFWRRQFGGTPAGNGKEKSLFRVEAMVAPRQHNVLAIVIEDNLEVAFPEPLQKQNRESRERTRISRLSSQGATMYDNLGQVLPRVVLHASTYPSHAVTTAIKHGKGIVSNGEILKGRGPTRIGTWTVLWAFVKYSIALVDRPRVLPPIPVVPYDESDRPGDRYRR